MKTVICWLVALFMWLALNLGLWVLFLDILVVFLGAGHRTPWWSPIAFLGILPLTAHLPARFVRFLRS